MGGSRRIVLMLAAFSIRAQTRLPPDLALTKIRQRMVFNLNHQPNYTCVETIERFDRPKPTAKLEVVDTLRIEVALVDGREMFAWPGAKKFEEADVAKMITGGSIGNGDFGTHAKALFTIPGPEFRYVGEEDFQGKKAIHFEYKMAQAVSTYSIRRADASSIVGYHGSFYANPATFDVERIEVSGDNLPAVLTLSSVEDKIDYAVTRIGDGDFLLPSESELSLVDLKGAENRNLVKFNSCREFVGESLLTFGNAPTSKEQAPVPTREFDLPRGLHLEMVLTKNINIRTAAIGDPVSARLNRDVRDPKDRKLMILPKGATAMGRIVRLEKQRESSVLIGIEFPDIEAQGILAHMKGTLFSTIPPLSLPPNKDLRTKKQPGEGVMSVSPAVHILSHGYILVWRT